MHRNSDQIRRIREGTSQAMRRVAERKKCPHCLRKMAIFKRKCRWCGFIKGTLQNG